ncbi:MAG: hypothetical protein J7459_05995, partial [Chloroflexus sp.]|nr:hypothetical protein [Chloroflexus sp.]
MPAPPAFATSTTCTLRQRGNWKDEGPGRAASRPSVQPLQTGAAPNPRFEPTAPSALRASAQRLKRRSLSRPLRARLNGAAGCAR